MEPLIDLVIFQTESVEQTARPELPDNGLRQPQAFRDPDSVELVHALVDSRRCRASSTACDSRGSSDSLRSRLGEDSRSEAIGCCASSTSRCTCS